MGYWKIIISLKDGQEGFRQAAFVFPQNARRKAKIVKYVSTIDNIEKRTGLDFLWELPDDAEEKVEGDRNEQWVQESFK